jgi:PST family polysaccharide transporter
VTDAARRFAAGASWLYAHRGLERLLDFAATVVLARILSPEDFGLVAIAASAVAIVEGLSAFDVNRALIRTRDDDRALYDTAWTLSALRGLAVALVMLAVATLVADPRTGAVLSLMALGPLVGGLANPRFVAFERDLVYSRLALLTLGAKVASVAATLAVAVLYRSYWALVVGLLVGTAASTLLSYALRPYRPRLTLARSADLAAFSGWLSLATLVTTLSMETDRVIVGALLGFAEAGLYFMTVSVGALPTRELVSPLQRMLLPSFSERALDRGRLRRAAVESINVLGSLSLAAGFGFALVANDFVPLALGGQWRPIVPLLVVLVPYLGLRATLSMALPCVMALGRTRLLAGVSLAYAVVHLPVFVAGTARFGLRGAVGAIVVAGVLYSWLNAWMLKRALDVTLGEILAQLRRPLVAAVLMAAAVLALAAASPLDLFSTEGSWRSLLVKAAVGAAVYVAALYVQWRWGGRPVGIERRVLQLISR